MAGSATASPITEGERVDRYLVRTGGAASRQAAVALIGLGAVRVNGRRCRKGGLVKPEDLVEVLTSAAPLVIAPNSEVIVEILFQSNSLLVVNKPGLMHCYPLRPQENHTVMNGAVAAYPETATAGDKPLEGGLVHRLDNGTSGALMIARESVAFPALRDALRSGVIRRRYTALVTGKIEKTREITTPIAHHPHNPRKMVLGGPGRVNYRGRARPALTQIEPLESWGGQTLLAVTPRTGCRHQIRLHLASLGHPLIGDALYGGRLTEQLAPGRFWLHLSEIESSSPLLPERFSARAPLAADLLAILPPALRHD